MLSSEVLIWARFSGVTRVTVGVIIETPDNPKKGQTGRTINLKNSNFFNSGHFCNTKIADSRTFYDLSIDVSFVN